MSDQTIRAGDLVMVVRAAPCGCMSEVAGIPFVVERIGRSDCHCTYCGQSFGERTWADLDDGRAQLLSSLIKLPPLSDPDHVDHKEELTA